MNISINTTVKNILDHEIKLPKKETIDIIKYNIYAFSGFFIILSFVDIYFKIFGYS